MPTREGSAHWEGTLEDGRGTTRTGSGALDANLTFGSRFEESSGTNPEELIAAAHAGCFSMAFSKLLSDAGSPPDALHTRALVTLEKSGDGFAITRSHLHARGTVPGISQEEYERLAREAKDGCPVSKALAGVEITIQADLAGA
jgi:osmotically inducible protein OsmC